MSNRPPLSLAARAMAFVALAIGLSLALIGQLVAAAVEGHFADQDAAELAVMTRAVSQALAAAADDPVLLPRTLARAVSGHHGVYFQVQDRHGTRLYASPGADLGAARHLEPVTKIVPANLATWQADGSHFRGVVSRLRLGERQYRITAAIAMDAHLHFLQRFRRHLWLIMALAGALTLTAAWLGVRQGLAPLHSLSDSMRRIQADRLHLRLDPGQVPRELGPLVQAFNSMIGRLEEGFTRLSHFSADIAHELRTPLTNLTTQTQVALGKSRSPEQYRELLYSSLEELERLTKMVNDMLWLAKSEHGLIRPSLAAVDLAMEIRALFEFFDPLAAEHGLSLELTGTVPAIQGDRALLRRALSNLLSNAIRHSPPGAAIALGLRGLADGDIQVDITNSGETIAPEHLDHLFDRFYRVDPSRRRHSDGAGLGLAIVRSIIESHGGTIWVTSKQGLTTFSFRLPGAAAPRETP
ncbi:heavy metal sensor histidine kinase [Gallaecimonas sp. GXIMD4217]|uniref:heavy metal sensor histidine kinase n=1 Tax=Gallaecimonas sp. GXIMD4217 TaxID=3131927 RepID=UPI00311AF3EE